MIKKQENDSYQDENSGPSKSVEHNNFPSQKFRQK